MIVAPMHELCLINFNLELGQVGRHYLLRSELRHLIHLTRAASQASVMTGLHCGTHTNNALMAAVVGARDGTRSPSRRLIRLITSF